MPKTDKLSTAAARERFAEIVNRAAYAKDRLLLTRRGKAVAAVVPIEDLQALEELEDRLDEATARQRLREVERKGSVPLEEVLARYGHRP